MDTHEISASDIVDNAHLNRYEWNIDGAMAYATYSRANNVIAFIHTEVPAALGGRGIGSALARHVLDAARARGETVIPRCSFIARYIQNHPEYQDLLAT